MIYHIFLGKKVTNDRGADIRFDENHVLIVGERRDSARSIGPNAGQLLEFCDAL